MKAHVIRDGKGLCGRRKTNPAGDPCLACHHLASLAGHYGAVAQYEAQRTNIAWMSPKLGVAAFDDYTPILTACEGVKTFDEARGL